MKVHFDWHEFEKFSEMIYICCSICKTAGYPFSKENPDTDQIKR